MGLLEAFGKFLIYGTMFAFGLVGTVFFILGLVILFWCDKIHTAKTTGVYSNVTCIQSTCTGNVTYKVSSNTFTISNQAGNITNGTSADVMYDPKNPSNGKVPSHGRFLGIILSILGAIFLYGSFASYKAFSSANNGTKQTISQVAGVAGVAQYFRPGV